MKKILSLILVLLMLSFVIACGDDPVETNTGSSETTTTDTGTDTGSDASSDTSTDTETDTDTNTDTGSDVEDKNDILGPGWSSPQS